MISERKLTANRANAKRSTGPRTKNGKFMSRRNAVKHGLAAKEELDRIKGSPEYQNLERALFDDLQPVGAAQEVLVERIASLSCRLRRVHIVEELYLRMQAQELREEAEVEDIEIEEFATNRGDEALGLYLTFQNKYTIVEQLQRYEIIYTRALNAAFRQLQLLKDLTAREEAFRQQASHDVEAHDASSQDDRAACQGCEGNARIEPEVPPRDLQDRIPPMETDAPPTRQNESEQNEPTAAGKSLPDEQLQQPDVDRKATSLQCDNRRSDDSPVPASAPCNREARHRLPDGSPGVSANPRRANSPTPFPAETDRAAPRPAPRDLTVPLVSVDPIPGITATGRSP